MEMEKRVRFVKFLFNNQFPDKLCVFIDCYDFAAIHKFGGFGCKNALPDVYARKFNECIAVALRN